MCWSRFQTEGKGRGEFEIGVWILSFFFLPFLRLCSAALPLMYVDVHERLSYEGIDCVIGISSLPTVSFTLINLKNNKKKACLF